jgi:hypothetical protein
MNTPEEIRQALREQVLIVDFVKKNGDIRTLVCTTIEDIIPPTFGYSVPNDEIITAWDVVSEGWRSFRVDSIISIETQP